MAPYTPYGPYQFASGKHKGQYLETLMFQNYGFVDWYLKKLNREISTNGSKNRLHLHLEWLITQGETRIPSMLCPVCGLKPIAQFSVIGDPRIGLSMSTGYAACQCDTECKRHIASMCCGKMPTWKPAKFSSIITFGYKADQDRFTQLLREIYGLTERINAQRAYDFFRY
ncbi:MAG: hypothetical protein WCP93_03365 [Candidatus Berkelbacteria bacterium]